MRSVFVSGREWFDKVNGNTYQSARVFVDGVEVGRVEFQYGYGDQYRYSAARLLSKLGLMPEGWESVRPLWQLKDFGVDVYSSLCESSKRDCVAWGKSEEEGN